MRKAHVKLALGAVALLVVGHASGCTEGLLAGIETSTPATAQATGPAPDYDRDAQFGDWVTRGGCDTRERELEAAAPHPVDSDGDGCRDDAPVVDFYTGRLIHSAHWTHAQADHVVPLHLVWSVGGGHTWPRDRRVAIANDPDNVVITTARTNRDDKSDKGPDGWRPDNPARWCAYAESWVLVVERYDLTWPQERAEDYAAALNDMCPGDTR